MPPLCHTGTVRIETDRLILRRLRPEDAVSIHENWGADTEVYKYMTSPRMPLLDDVEFFIKRKLSAYASPDFYYWGIEEKAGGGVVGMVTGTEVSGRDKSCNLAFAIGRKWWGKGIAREASEAVLAHFFRNVGMRTVYGCHFTDNIRSGALLLALGMRYTGSGREPMFHRGEYLRFENYELDARRYFRLKRARRPRAAE